MKTAMKDIYYTILAARTLISDKENWTTRTLARHREGFGVYPTNDDACKWCIQGAIMACGPNTTVVEKSMKILNVAAMRETVCKHGVACLNDKEGHEVTLNFVDRMLNWIEEGGGEWVLKG